MKRIVLLLIMLFIIADISFQQNSAEAETRVVQTDVCSSTTTTSHCYTNLATAIAEANPGDSIQIKPGTYKGSFFLNKNVSIEGTETAATFLQTDSTGAALTISSVTSAITIRRLTFVNPATGISIQNSPSVTVNNCAFVSGTNAGIEIAAGSTGTQIINNVFSKNGTGILSSVLDVSITNNIFYKNTTAITSTVTISGIKNNLFFSNSSIGPSAIIFNDADTGWLGNIQTADPLFVHPEDTDYHKLDFHLQKGTPAQDKGHTDGGTDKIDNTDPDIGAYGGSNSDTIPAPVVVSEPIISGSTLTVSWSRNTAYQVGGYKFYSGSSPRSYDSPVEINDPLATSYTFTAASIATAPTGTPVLTNEIASGRLPLFWNVSAVKGATGYEVHYALQSAGTTTVIDVKNVTNYDLNGLVNATADLPYPYYDVYVIPYAQDNLYMAVKAYYATNKNFESAFSNEVSKNFGGKIYGVQSNTITDYPEVIQSPLNLPNSGCFIATAAYGYYSAPQVQALREFRDRYLITNRLGRAFVEWYYRYGPIGAMLINKHRWLKPVVRAALLPAVGVSLFLLHTSLSVKIGTFLLLVALSAILIVQKIILSSRGGSR